MHLSAYIEPCCDQPRSTNSPLLSVVEGSRWPSCVVIH